MQPIVNGIEDDYQEEIEIRRIDAESPEGMTIFNGFSLRGHPSYLLIDPEGQILWQSLGEQPGDDIREQIDSFLLLGSTP